MNIIIGPRVDEIIYTERSYSEFDKSLCIQYIRIIIGIIL